MTNESHRCIPAVSWVEACALIKVVREDVDYYHLHPECREIAGVAKKLHRIEQILLTSDPVATPHLGDDFGPEETCKRAMEGMR